MSPLDIPVEIGGDEARRRALEELAKAKYGGPRSGCSAPPSAFPAGPNG